MLLAETKLWCAPYIGARYADDGKPPAFNCWTLFAHVQRNVFGIDIADYDGPVWKGREGVAAMAQAARAFAQCFTEVARGEEREGDAVLMRLRGHPIHIGVVTAKGSMLHVYQDTDAVVERYDAPLWRHRIVAFYRPH